MKTAEKRNVESQKQKNEQEQRYQAMLSKARNWKPPPLDHIELKRFLVSQLTESILRDSF